MDIPSNILRLNYFFIKMYLIIWWRFCKHTSSLSHHEIRFGSSLIILSTIDLDRVNWRTHRIYWSNRYQLVSSCYLITFLAEEDRFSFHRDNHQSTFANSQNLCRQASWLHHLFILRKSFTFSPKSKTWNSNANCYENTTLTNN